MNITWEQVAMAVIVASALCFIMWLIYKGAPKRLIAALRAEMLIVQSEQLRAERQRDELATALKQCVTLLDALRMDCGVHRILTDSQRALYQDVDDEAKAALAKGDE